MLPLRIPEPARADAIHLAHLGASGLRVAFGGASIEIDPPWPGPGSAIVTWSEAERIAGIGGRPLAAHADLLAWLGRAGVALGGDPVAFAGFEVLATPYAPIPYATPREALRKALIGLRHPSFAARRLSRTLRRPGAPPLAITLSRGGRRVALLGQALHRFLVPGDLERLVARHGGADLLVAGTDYDDELATGRLAGAFGAGRVVIADLIGLVRRGIGLPTRPIEVSLSTAPAGARALREGEEILS